MKITTSICFILAAVISFCSCKQTEKKKPLKAVFGSGEVQFISTTKPVADGYEMTLMSRYWIDKKEMTAELSNYFQYQLGKKIKLVIGSDTLNPVLFYYMPLINETEKAIDCKYLLAEKDIGKPKRIIIDDSLLDLNKINLPFK